MHRRFVISRKDTHHWIASVYAEQLKVGGNPTEEQRDKRTWIIFDSVDFETKPRFLVGISADRFENAHGNNSFTGAQTWHFWDGDEIIASVELGPRIHVREGRHGDTFGSHGAFYADTGELLATVNMSRVDVGDSGGVEVPKTIQHLSVGEQREAVDAWRAIAPPAIVDLAA